METFENSFEENGRKIAFLDLLLKIHKEDPGAFTRKDIREEVDTFMFEGHDTTTYALFGACHAISQNPEIQSKLHEEIDLVIGKCYRVKVQLAFLIITMHITLSVVVWKPKNWIELILKNIFVKFCLNFTLFFSSVFWGKKIVRIIKKTIFV